jgi:hypothetical protein
MLKIFFLKAEFHLVLYSTTFDLFRIDYLQTTFLSNDHFLRNYAKKHFLKVLKASFFP